MAKTKAALPAGWRIRADGTLVIPDDEPNPVARGGIGLVARAERIETNSGKILKSRDA